MQKIILLIALLMMSGCRSFPIDQAMGAHEGNDQVAILSGPGVISQKGYLFLQENQGVLPTTDLSLVVPSTTCKRDSCARFQFFKKDGSAGFAGGVLKGQTRVNFKLSDILGHVTPVEDADDSEYRVLIQIFFLNSDGNEMSMLGDGFLRLNVLSSLYRPIGCNDPNVVFKVKASDKCEAQFTTAFRSAACGTCQ